MLPGNKIVNREPRRAGQMIANKRNVLRFPSFPPEWLQYF
jgi:hypothetical protein